MSDSRPPELITIDEILQGLKIGGRGLKDPEDYKRLFKDFPLYYVFFEHDTLLEMLAFYSFLPMRAFERIKKIVNANEKNSSHVQRDYRNWILSQINFNIKRYLNQIPLVFPDKEEIIGGIDRYRSYIKNPQPYMNTIIKFMDNFRIIEENKLIENEVAPEYKPIVDIETLAAETNDPQQKEEYQARIKSEADRLKNMTYVMEDKKLEDIERWKLSGGYITPKQYLKVISKVRGIPITRNFLLNDEQQELNKINDERLKKFLMEYEAKNAKINGTGAIPTTTNQAIYNEFMKDFNKKETVKVAKSLNKDTMMTYTYPFNFPACNIKIKNGNYVIEQEGKPPKNFGINYFLAREYCIKGGAYEKDLLEKTELAKLYTREPKEKMNLFYQIKI